MELGRVIDQIVIGRLKPVLELRHGIRFLGERHAVGDVGVTAVLGKQQPSALWTDKVQVQICDAGMIDSHPDLGRANQKIVGYGQ